MYKYHLVISKSRMLRRRDYFQKTGFHHEWGFWWLSLYFLIFEMSLRIFFVYDGHMKIFMKIPIAPEEEH